MARTVPDSPSLTRRGPKEKPKKLIYIFCEGHTEKEYLDAFRVAAKNPRVEVECVGRVGVPLTVVQRAREQIRSLKREAAKSKNSFDAYFEVWGVIDVDEHPNLSEALVMAQDNGVKVALSNPCFELWGLLHYQEQTAFIHRHALQKALAEVMKGYHHEKNASFNYKEMSPGYSNAVKRAKAGEVRKEADGDPRGNPSTSVHRLTESIRT